jgi:hypothetical protein
MVICLMMLVRFRCIRGTIGETLDIGDLDGSGRESRVRVRRLHSTHNTMVWYEPTKRLRTIVITTRESKSKSRVAMFCFNFNTM